MAQVTFLYPWVLLWLAAVPVLLLFLLWTEQRRRRRLQRMGEPVLLAMLMAQVSTARRRWKAVLWLLCVALLIVALARPTWGLRTDVIETQGASVFVLLDVSTSMNAEDLAPSRLERAKLSTQDLALAIEGNELGMITFAGSAFVFFPLTTDTRSAQSFVGFVSSDTISRQGTAIGAAIDLAMASFDETQATERVIVLFSDGEDHTAETDAAVQAAIESGVTIHVVGFGTEGGGSIPIRDSAGAVVGNKLDRTGNIIITRIEEDNMQQIARRTGGVYQRIDPAGEAINNVARLINAADGSPLGEDERTAGVERFALFGALALMLLSLEMLLPETKES